ncbi:hypothetical protein ANACOL_01261 [Anaerotruncus colihominis DSM 17241]|uniref:Uncharacterized protein n=1 Tax=Anaerotruncus colihominis DSM 17241 TaxID=445972 RepID=B0P914_9FIRM|nr:hypothetical protein ANACOL_01261 [Anaerotruncus colihominis DSM 17241]
MGHYADIACHFQRYISRHSVLPYFLRSDAGSASADAAGKNQGA